jgi:alkanesulfonate monooxygenase SsuD/methylene tetrahydromethanopterin reductase-like flavin-dependent oxidoreductase (luciferase family)
MRLPILVSALGEKAFQLAGEIADGALSWLCPVPYLLHTGLPAVRKGAAIAGRSASPPPLVACSSSTYYRSPVGNGSRTSINRYVY